MKRSALQCVVGFIGASLIVVGVVWTCKQLSSPRRLNAAQSEFNSATSRPTTKAPSKPSGSLSLSIESPSTWNETVPSEQRTNANNESIRQNETQRIRPVSGGSLNLSVIETDATAESNQIDDNDFSNVGFKDEEQVPEISPLESFPSSSFETELDDPNLLDNGQNSLASVLSESDDSQFQPETAEDNREVSSFISVQSEQDAIPQFEQAQTIPSTLPSPREDLDRLDDLLQDGEEASEAPTALPQTVEVNNDQNVDSLPVPSTRQYATPIVSRDQLEDAPFPRVSEQRSESDSGNKSSSSNNQIVNEILQFVERAGLKRSNPDVALLGPQKTQLIVEKRAPEEVQLNEKATINVIVKNAGDTEIKDIILRDSVPEGTVYVSEQNSVAPNKEGELIWAPFSLMPQEEKTFSYVVKPEREGTFGSAATVMFATSASSQTQCSRPELKLEVSAPSEVEINQVVRFNIIVTNVGTGVAENVSLRETIPEGLFHPSGAVLNNNGLGAIKAGESKSISLELKAVSPGVVVNSLAISADNCDEQIAETELKILSPSLELEITGPQNVYLERTAKYKLSVKNTGDLAAFDAQLIAKLPEGVKFVKANNYGAYRQENHCVYWDLAELPARSNADVELEVETTAAGQCELTFSASGPNNLKAQTSRAIVIDGLAALSFNVTSSTDLVEVGKEFEYSIQIENRGTKASNNVVLQILTPDAISILATDGPTKATSRNGVVVFEKIASVPAKSSVVYKVKASPSAAGDCRVGFQLSSDDLEPLVKEENARVYE